MGRAGPGHCDTCSTEKAKREPLNKKWEMGGAVERMASVHTDVLGPVQQTSYEGFRYAFGFIGSFSRYAAINPKKCQDEVLDKLELFMADVGQTSDVGLREGSGIQI